jgi:transketolase
VSAVQQRAPFAEALLELAEQRPETVVLVGDLARYVEVAPFAERYPGRFLQLGMAEQNIVGMASGLAKTGWLPVVVTYGVFITRRAYDQVAMALTTGPTRAILVGFMPGITTPFRASHQSIDDVALMRALPGMTVVDPADEVDVQGALSAAAELAGPTYVRAFRGAQPLLPRSGFALGAAVELSSGVDAAFVSSGLGTQWALEAVALLEARGMSVAHLHVPTIKPLDSAAVAAFCSRHERVLCVENHTVVGGLCSAVAEVIAGEGLGTRLVSAGVPDVWPPAGSLDYIRRELGLDAESLGRRALP